MHKTKIILSEEGQCSGFQSLPLDIVLSIQQVVEINWESGLVDKSFPEKAKGQSLDCKHPSIKQCGKKPAYNPSALEVEMEIPRTRWLARLAK